MADDALIPAVVEVKQTIMVDNTFIPKGMEIVRAAVDADNADELEKALSLYRQGLGWFMTGLKYMRNEASKAAIREKMATYMKRAEDIKEAIDKRAARKARKSHIPKGQEAIDRAIEAENADDLEQAVELYRKGLSHFMTGLGHMTNEPSKVTIREKMAQYMKHCEDIKDVLDIRTLRRSVAKLTEEIDKLSEPHTR